MGQKEVPVSPIVPSEDQTNHLHIRNRRSPCTGEDRSRQGILYFQESLFNRIKLDVVYIMEFRPETRLLFGPLNSCPEGNRRVSALDQDGGIGLGGLKQNQNCAKISLKRSTPSSGRKLSSSPPKDEGAMIPLIGST